MIRFAPVALATLLAATAFAQSSRPPAQFTDPANLRGERVSPRTGRELPVDKGALGLEELLRKLNTRASILNIVAHPDDEDGGMLTLYARGYGARVADLSLTRGEGGQNAATSDFDDALGLLRTQELLANDRYTGVTQMFGTEVDFGFSKTKAESFAKWTHQRVLYDAVRAIRLFRPLVITATFIGNPTDGHGQHQVSGEIAQEAFVAAGDPNVFPELTKEGILPWQPLRMYARVPTYAISSKGLFDYATGQYVPARFTNYVTGVTSTTPPTPDITIHEGADDPLITTCAANPSDLPPQLKPASSTAPDCRPLSYVQFARIGLGLQRTQIGPGVRNARAGVFDVPYHLFGSRLCGTPVSLKDCHPERSEGPASTHAPALPFEPSALASQPNFFDGIDTSIEGIATLAPKAFPSDLLFDVAHGIHAATEQFDPKDPAKIAPALAASLKNLDQLIAIIQKWKGDPIQKENALHELRIKRVQLNDALVLALGLSFDASAQFVSGGSDIATGSPVEVHTALADALPTPLPLHDISLSVDKMSPCERTYLPAMYTAYADVALSKDPTNNTLTLPSKCLNVVTQPYFNRKNIEQPYYDLNRAALRNAPGSPPAITAWATVEYVVPVKVGRIVHNGPQPVSIVPPLNAMFGSESQTVSSELNHYEATLKVTGDPDMIKDVKVMSPAPPYSQKGVLGKEPIWISGALTDKTHRPFTIAAAYFLPQAIKPQLLEGFRPIGYGDLPRTNFYTPATDRIVPIDLKLPPPNKRRIAYLEGTGDDVPAALASIGLKPTILTIADLTPAKLSQFDTVILGVRTYNAHPDLHGAPTEALLNFARSGGNVVVQYQTREFTAADAPFPLSLGSDEKVVDETDPVEILHTDSTLLTTPNHIATSDFAGWIEERGHGFLGSWDPRYTALTETHDPGQLPQRGGLITVRLGKGRWTYCAFALYRQLPEAVPGAFRLFTNLLTP
jgi:LmbE family N-acetylglucosaminyl deacetylase